MPLMKRLTLVAALAGLSSPGCYSAVALPPGPPALERGAPIEAELAPPTTLSAGDQQVQMVVRVDGAYIDWTERHLLVSADRLVAAEQRFQVQGATVLVPHERIAALYSRELDRTRTALFASGIVAGVILMPILFGRGLGGVEGPGGPPDPK
jgi:hypothetical protein